MDARRLLRMLLLVQLVAAGLVGHALAAWCGAGWGVAILAGAGALLLVRLLISANNFRLSARAASATPREHRIGARAALRLFGEEFAASMRYAAWTMPRARPCLRVYRHTPAAPTAPPVLLVHGYGCNSGYWAHLTPLLDAARISHATLDLAPVTAAIDDYVPAVDAGVRALLAATGATHVVIVAHSMGGLVARAWMRAHGLTHLARLITLGTPHHGTALASFGIGANAAQMRRDGPWLRALAGAESPAARARITSIYSHHDNIVAPQTSSELAGARNLAFGGVGHVALAANRRILTAVLAELEQARAPASAAAGADGDTGAGASDSDSDSTPHGC